MDEYKVGDIIVQIGGNHILKVVGTTPTCYEVAFMSILGTPEFVIEKAVAERGYVLVERVGCII